MLSNLGAQNGIIGILLPNSIECLEIFYGGVSWMYSITINNELNSNTYYPMVMLDFFSKCSKTNF